MGIEAASHDDLLHLVAKLEHTQSWLQNEEAEAHQQFSWQEKPWKTRPARFEAEIQTWIVSICLNMSQAAIWNISAIFCNVFGSQMQLEASRLKTYNGHRHFDQLRKRKPPCGFSPSDQNQGFCLDGPQRKLLSTQYSLVTYHHDRDHRGRHIQPHVNISITYIYNIYIDYI